MKTNEMNLASLRMAQQENGTKKHCDSLRGVGSTIK